MAIQLCKEKIYFAILLFSANADFFRSLKKCVSVYLPEILLLQTIPIPDLIYSNI